MVASLTPDDPVFKQAAIALLYAASPSVPVFLSPDELQQKDEMGLDSSAGKQISRFLLESFFGTDSVSQGCRATWTRKSISKASLASS